MSQIDTNEIRRIAQWLQHQSVSISGNPYAPVTKHDLEKLRDNVSNAILTLAEALDH